MSETPTTPYEYINIPPATKIRIGPSSIAGYGVFATDNIWIDEIIEVATYVKTRMRTKDLLYNEIRELLYPWPCACDQCKYRGPAYTICSGAIHLYNSVTSEEERMVKLMYNNENRTISVVAVKPINKGEEILNWYGDSYPLPVK